MASNILQKTAGHSDCELFFFYLLPEIFTGEITPKNKITMRYRTLRPLFIYYTARGISPEAMDGDVEL